MAKAKTTITTDSSGELLVYIGPNIINSKNDILLAFQTFEEIPAYAAENGDLRRLFVPLSQMAPSRQELTVKGSRLYNAAKAVREQIAAARKEGK